MIAIMLLVFVSIARPGYGNIDNLNLLAVMAAILGITSLGQTFVVLTAGLDLSIPWMFSISAFLMAGLSHGQDEALFYVVPFVLLVGFGMGLLNGFGVAYIGISPIIMTMATNIIFQGLLIGITGGMPSGGASGRERPRARDDARDQQLIPDLARDIGFRASHTV